MTSNDEENPPGAVKEFYLGKEQRGRAWTDPDDEDEISGVTLKFRDRDLDGEDITPEYLREIQENNEDLELVQATFLVTGDSDP